MLNLIIFVAHTLALTILCILISGILHSSIWRMPGRSNLVEALASYWPYWIQVLPMKIMMNLLIFQGSGGIIGIIILRPRT